ncbi:PepSY domain-containing protein [Qipengyuania sp. GH25]|uniref:PepSY domain-containing protein n=1 Tax=Qipengyuania pacifica TaxID=2860199 RepID=A0ABS7JK69_9SPHN|nr:PepSY domain-containing protein [Qipengyuania aerophila]MBX7489786.1 PepSY domain-containing protein [Qipengyuania aerophila]
MNSDFYRAAWRWHFFGGLAVLPLLAWLAVTGGIYLFKDEIEHSIYGDYIFVAPHASPLPLSQLMAGTEGAMGGTVERIEIPAANNQAWRMRIMGPDGERTAFVDPSDGTIRGTVAGGGAMQTIHDLHSLAITGPIGNALIEMAAGWAIMLTVTGVILWWPMKSKIPFRKSVIGRRGFWKDGHATLGAGGGVIVLFLAISGMPWSGVWGAQLQSALTATGLGRPQQVAKAHTRPIAVGQGDDITSSTRTTRGDVPWSMENRVLPKDVLSQGGIDTVLQVSLDAGLATPLAINVPADGVSYSVTSMQKKVEFARTMFIGQDGMIHGDTRFADYGTGAKVVEWGVATHQGKQYGEANRWVMLAGCLVLLLLCASAPILWWKRRTGGRLARPPAPLDRSRQRSFSAAMIACGLFFPLTGASMLAIWIVDKVITLSAKRRSQHVHRSMAPQRRGIT